MTNPSQSQDPHPDSVSPHKDESSQFNNPISLHDEDNQKFQSPQTLETSRTQIPENPDPNIEETQLLFENQEQEEDESSGMVLTISTTKLRNRRYVNKRKQASEFKKQQAIDKKVQNLLQLGALISFMPSKRLDFDKHAVLFKRLELWDFVHIKFDEPIREDIVGQFIVSYDVTKKCCCVNGVRIYINRTKFAKVLKLPFPVKKDKVVGNVAEAAIDLDLVQEKVSEECVEFVEDFVRNWVILHGDDWVMSNEIRSWMGMIKDGHPEKVDWATLIWVMVENELKQRDQLRTVYYASHLQYFIKSQRKELFDEDGENVVANEEMKEEGKLLSEEDKKVEAEEIRKDEELLEEAQKVDEKEVMNERYLLRERLHEVDVEGKKEPHEEVAEEVKEGPREEVVEVEGAKKDTDGSFYDSSKEQEKMVVEELNIEFTLGQQDLGEKEDIKDDNMAVEECKATEYDRRCFAAYDKGSKHFLQPCIFGEGRGSDGNEERKQEVEQLEMEEEEHMEEVDHMQEWEQMEAEDVEDSEGDEMGEQMEVEDDEEEEEEEELEDGIQCNITTNYGSLQGVDLTGDLLQGFETGQLPLNLQGQQLHENSSMDIFASNAETHLIMGGPSMYGNGRKRVIDYEQDTSHLNGSKRIRTDVGWDQKTSDFGFCVSQAQQFMEKAKIIYEEKDQAYNEVNINQQYLLQELQRRDGIIENLQRDKDEELQKKDREIYRLERELSLLEELVNGYRQALKQNRSAFLEYRQRCRLPEEPIYKDAGPGGLVLSIAGLEKQRQQKENEDRLKCLVLTQKYNEALEGYINQFQVLLSKVRMIDVNRLNPIADEVKLLKELYAAKRRASENPDWRAY